MMAVVLVLGVLAATGCTPTQSGGGGTSGTPVKGGTLSRSTSASRPTSIRTTPRSPRARRSSQALFDSLTQFDPSIRRRSFRPPPSLGAQRGRHGVDVQAQPERQVLRRTPVTAKDFVYAWNRIANPKTKNTATGKADPSIDQLPPRASSRATTTSGRQGRPSMSGVQGGRRLHPRGDADVAVRATSSTSSRTRRWHRCRRSTSRAASTTRARRSPSATCRSATARSRCPSRGSTTSTSRSSRNHDYYGDEAATSTASTSRSSRIRRPPTPSSRPATSTSPRSARARSRPRSPSTASRPTATPSTRASRCCSAPRTSTYYLVCNNKDKYLRTPTSARRSRSPSTARRSATTIFEGTREPGRQHRAAGHRGLRGGHVGVLQVRRRGSQGRARRRPAIPEGKGLPDDQAVSFNTRRRPREDHAARPGRPRQASASRPSSTRLTSPTYLKQLRCGQVPDRPPRLDRRLPDHGQLPVPAVQQPRVGRQQVEVQRTRRSTAGIDEAARSITDDTLRASPRTRRSTRRIGADEPGHPDHVLQAPPRRLGPGARASSYSAHEPRRLREDLAHRRRRLK